MVNQGRHGGRFRLFGWFGGESNSAKWMAAAECKERKDHRNKAFARFLRFLADPILMAWPWLCVKDYFASQSIRVCSRPSVQFLKLFSRARLVAGVAAPSSVEEWRAISAYPPNSWPQKNAKITKGSR
jgi:hypothetical protein